MRIELVSSSPHLVDQPALSLCQPFHLHTLNAISTGVQRQCILDSGGMRGLEHLLQARETPRQEAAVEALAALTMGNADALDTIVASRESVCMSAPCHACYMCFVPEFAPVFNILEIITRRNFAGP
jgi:hypothetical protein